MPARKPGGKYKGKVPRTKGEATIAAELEAKRRKAYEANLAKLQERRQQELLAEQGLQSEEEEAQAMKLARIAQMFGTGKKGLLTKFWKNWKIGMIAMRREKAIEERKTCWRRSCDFCDVVPIKKSHRHGEFGPAHSTTCKGWWTNTLDREDWGVELHPKEAAADRPDVVNKYRSCTCCGADTGLPGLGCRTYHSLRDVGFLRPSEVEERLAAKDRQAARQRKGSVTFQAALAASASAPTLHLRKSPRSPGLKLSVQSNWTQVKNESNAQFDVPEYDPSEAYVMSRYQEMQEERRAWSDGLSAMAGSPVTRIRSGQIGFETMYRQASLPSLAPPMTEKKEPLEEVAHWRTGQKTMFDKHMAKMYVVGVQ